MDPQFQELAREIADAVEKRLSGAFEERIKEHIDTVEERIATNVETRLSGAFEQRIKTHIDQFEQRAEQRMKMHFEKLDGLIMGAAEGYGINLERIERELKDLNRKLDTTVGDHGRVIANHSDKIAKLEEHR